MNNKIITAVYTICKNELKNLKRWLYYGSFYDYRVLLDTGSTDGTWEALQEYAKQDSNLIIEQKLFEPFHFANARNYNLNMVPDHVNWCLCPDLDEFYTKNTLDELYQVLQVHPDLTNLSCDRFDLYSYTPRVGPPNFMAFNKIHKRHDYEWFQPIYEYLRWKRSGYKKELYSDSIYLVHDQDFDKPERAELYIKMLVNEYENNPTNTWCLWYLNYHYRKSLNLPKFIKTGCDYVTFELNKNNDKYKTIIEELKNIYTHNPPELTDDDFLKIKNTLVQLHII